MVAGKVKIASPVSGIDDLKNVVTIASESVEMGRIIMQAAEKMGKTGLTVVEENQTLFDEINLMGLNC